MLESEPTYTLTVEGQAEIEELLMGKRRDLVLWELLQKLRQAWKYDDVTWLQYYLGNNEDDVYMSLTEWIHDQMSEENCSYD